MYWLNLLQEFPQNGSRTTIWNPNHPVARTKNGNSNEDYNFFTSNPTYIELFNLEWPEAVNLTRERLHYRSRIRFYLDGHFFYFHFHFFHKAPTILFSFSKPPNHPQSHRRPQQSPVRILFRIAPHRLESVEKPYNGLNVCVCVYGSCPNSVSHLVSFCSRFDSDWILWWFLGNAAILCVNGGSD